MLKAYFYLAIILTLRTDEAGQNKNVFVLFSCRRRQLQKLQSVTTVSKSAFWTQCLELVCQQARCFGTNFKYWKKCNLSLTLYATNEAPVW